MSVPQATVIQKVSHPPRKPKYRFLGEKSFMLTRVRRRQTQAHKQWLPSFPGTLVMPSSKRGTRQPHLQQRPFQALYHPQALTNPNSPTHANRTRSRDRQQPHLYHLRHGHARTKVVAPKLHSCPKRCRLAPMRAQARVASSSSVCGWRAWRRLFAGHVATIAARLSVVSARAQQLAVV